MLRRIGDNRVFDDVAGRLSFTHRPGEREVAWWHSTMPNDVTPEGIAAVLLRGLPGRRTAEWDIDVPQDSAYVTLEGREGNARLWIRSTRISVNAVHFYEDGLAIDHKRRGVGLAQRLMGNVVDLANSMGAGSVELDTDDVGGYVWAKAGFVPRDWTSLRLQVEARLRALQRSSGRVGEAEETTINALLSAGGSDPKVIRSIAGRETEVRSTNMREPGDPEKIAIGKQLLIGTNWNGELILGDRESMDIFGTWGERWERDLERRANGRSTPTPSREPGR